MDTLLAAAIGAGIAIIGGLIFRAVDSRQHRQQWVRDHLRDAAEQFLSDARSHLQVTVDLMVGDLPGDARAIVGPAIALAVDISRLQLVAPKPVFDEARAAQELLISANQAAHHITGDRFDETQGAALKAAHEAEARISRFADLVREHLR